MSRGNRREFVLKSSEDKALFMYSLEEVCSRCGWVVHAYVLMDNHFHLLLETPEPNLSDGMRWLQGTYATRYNRRHQLVGHVWQGRFKSPVISNEGDEHFFMVSRYIHLNPARAGLLDTRQPRLSEYKWSSFPLIQGDPSTRPMWLAAETTMRAYGLPRDDVRSRRKYGDRMEACARECVRGELDEEMERDRKQLMRGWYIGDEAFRDSLLDPLEQVIRGKKKESLRGAGYSISMEDRAHRIISMVCADRGEAIATLQSLPKTHPRKRALVNLLRQQTSVSYAWIIQELGMGSFSSVYQAIRAFRQGNETVVDELKKLEKLTNCED